MNAVDGLGGKGKKIGVPVVHSGRIVVINHAKRDCGGMVTREKPTLLITHIQIMLGFFISMMMLV